MLFQRILHSPVISIHALREEGDGSCQFVFDCVDLFLSTPSARRATKGSCSNRNHCAISIHALREEGDRLVCCTGHFDLRFLSTPSARRATQNAQTISTAAIISIHALREEGDLAAQHDAQALVDFYPRPPRGGRRPGSHCYGGMGQFLSTPSARRATFVNHEKHIVFVISIHALREEGDQSCTLNLPCHENFYPRPPRGGRRRSRCTRRGACRYFYPRPPRGGRHKTIDLKEPALHISIHALREEGDSKNRDKISIFL